MQKYTMEEEYRDFREEAKRKIDIAIRKARINSERLFKPSEEKIKQKLQNFLTKKGGKECDKDVLEVLMELGLAEYRIEKYAKQHPEKNTLNLKDLEEIVITDLQADAGRTKEFHCFLKEKGVNEISFPEKVGDWQTIIRLLRNFPPDVFEDFIAGIPGNLKKIPFEVLPSLAEELLEVAGPPSAKIPLTGGRAIRILAPVTLIVRYAAHLNNLKNTLNSDEKLEKEVKDSLPKGAYVLVLATKDGFFSSPFIRILDEIIESGSKFLIPSQMTIGEKVITEILEKKGVSFSKINLRDEDLRKLFMEKGEMLYVLPSNIEDLIGLKLFGFSIACTSKLEGRRKEIVRRIKLWKPGWEIKEEKIRDIMREAHKVASLIMTGA